MSQRNPSFKLSNQQLDNVIDRLQRGKYEKYFPVKPMEMMRTGILTRDRMADYIIARWGERSRWSSNKEAGLSRAGVTMRTNTLWERASTLIGSVDPECQELVWRIEANYDTICYVAGGREGARNWAFTLFGWTLGPNTQLSSFRALMMGADGPEEAAFLNTTLIPRIQNKIDEAEAASEKYTVQANRWKLIMETMNGVAGNHEEGG